MSLLTDDRFEILLVIVRLSPVALCAGLLFQIFRRATGSTAQAVLFCFLAMELIAVFQIEVLSLVTAYRPWPVFLLWCAAAGGALFWRRRAPRVERASEPWNSWECAAAGGCGVLLTGTLVTAIRGTPNTWDALSYHLPRVMHWIQNASIAHHASASSRQVKFPPLAEILVSQTILLSDGDRLVNLVQWSAYGVTAVAIYAAVRGAGLSRLAGLCGGLTFLSLPMAVLQASGPKNDLVLCANLAVAIAFFGASFDGLRWSWLVAGAAALGLAVLSKGTGIIFGGILAVLLAGAVLRRYGTRRCAAVVALLAIAIVVTNGGHFGRNLRRFGGLLGSGIYSSIREPGPGALASNLLRNVALHLGTPSEALNRSVESTVVGAHARLGLRIDDPLTTFPDVRFEVPRFPSRDEDKSGNPLQLLAIGAALLVAPWTLRPTAHAGFSRIVACGLLFGAAAFCLLLKWQPWHSRLHLPLFAVGCVLVPLVLWRRPRVLMVALLLMAAASLPALLANEKRPLLGKRSVLRQSRMQNLFRTDEDGGWLLRQRLAVLRPARIGLRLGGDDPEYLIWYVVRKAAPGVRLDHIGTSRPLPPRDAGVPPIDTVVTYDDEVRDALSIEGATYRFDRRCGRFTVWRLEEPGGASAGASRGRPNAGQLTRKSETAASNARVS